VKNGGALYIQSTAPVEDERIVFSGCTFINNDAGTGGGGSTLYMRQTGAITFLNRDYELKTYDRFGNLIYDTELFNTRGGYAHLDYEDGLLTVYVLRTEEVRKYDENGNLIDQQNDSEDPPYAWDTWERDSRSFFFETDTHIYRYTYPSLWRGLFFNDEVVVKIIDKETKEEIVLWK
jgi:hypothetical protein